MNSLRDITDRLESIATEMEAEETGEERIAELIREAADLAAQAGREVDAAMRSAAEAQRAD